MCVCMCVCVCVCVCVRVDIVVVVIDRMVDRLVYSSMRHLQKKLDVGKLY